MKQTFHLCVKVETALLHLNKGNNLFEPSTPEEVKEALERQMSEGKEYITGCDNEDSTGKCAGHNQ